MRILVQTPYRGRIAIVIPSSFYASKNKLGSNPMDIKTSVLCVNVCYVFHMRLPHGYHYSGTRTAEGTLRPATEAAPCATGLAQHLAAARGSGFFAIGFAASRPQTATNFLTRSRDQFCENFDQ